MKPLQIIAFCFLLSNYFSLSYLNAQGEVKFEHYTLEDGLRGARVYCIMQDHQGFIWVGTGFGISRFDGRVFKNYQHDPDDSLSISSDQISCIFEDRDHNLWIGTFDAGLNRFDRKTGQFHHYLHNPSNPNSLGGNTIYYSIVQDEEGNLWITTNNGVSKFNYKKELFTNFRHNPGDPNSISNSYASNLYIDKFQNLWIGTQYMLDCLNLKTGKITHYKNDPNDSNSVSESTDGYAITEDAFGNLWVATYGGGVSKFNRSTGKFTQYKKDPSDPYSLNDNEIGTLIPDKNGNLWITTQGGGLNFYDQQSGNFFHYLHDINNPSSIASNAVNTVFYDREDNIWVGTSGSGLSIATSNQFRFRKFPIAYSDDFGNQMRQDIEGNLWFGIPEKGLHKYNPKTGAIKIYQHNPNDTSTLSSNSISDIAFEGKDFVWTSIGLDNGGLNHLDLKTGKVTRFFHDPNNNNSLSTNWLQKLLLDKSNNLWITSGKWGLNKYNLKTNIFTRYFYDFSNPISFSNLFGTMLEDQQGYIWFSSRNGLYRYDPQANQFKQFIHNTHDANSLNDNYVQAIYEDSKGRIWIGTAKDGIDLYNPKTQTFSHYLKKEIPRPVLAIGGDNQGNLWLGTWGYGMVKFNPDRNILRFFGKEDGLVTEAFPNFIPVKSHLTQKMYFNNSSAIIEFQPDSVRDTKKPPPVFITALKTLKKNTKTGEIEEIEDDITYQKTITKSYRDNNLTFRLSVLSFMKPSKNRFAYQLIGLNEDWIQLGIKNEVTFTNLVPGRYTLRVKGANGDGYWNETPAELKIRITPPWYWAWYSQSFYALLLIGGIYSLYRFQLNRRLAVAEAVRLQELDQVKTRLYTNITHEFRTPLTIILGMADKIEQAPRQWLKEGMQMIKRNGQNLLRLVNQMLDLSKLEAGSLPVNLVQGDIIAYLRTLVEFFRSYAESKNINLKFESEPSELIMDYDPDKIKDIISNLLSNALKFTPEGGEIKLEVQSTKYDAQGDNGGNVLRTSNFVLRIVDNGVGIPPEKLPHIFDRFYQADDSATRHGEGTGIGLALTKELVKLLNGSIEVESAIGLGSTFTVRLPIHKTAPLLETLPAFESEIFERSAVVKQMPSKATYELPLALIVEDNVDVISYLSSCLENQYRIEVAYNGQVGIDKAIEIVPDIIISDVMMPEKDGFELCRTLKEDIRTSHIPIILLTARADISSRLEGLEGGADAYLTKPFNEQELEISLRKSLELRQRLRERYAKDQDTPYGSDKIFSKDDTFIKNLHQVLEEHYSNETFIIPDMAKALNMSHAQLGRKVNALLNTSPQLYLRQFRLKKAYHLLKHTDLSIKEVAFATGFDDPAYFSNIFLEEFQQRPSDFR